MGQDQFTKSDYLHLSKKESEVWLIIKVLEILHTGRKSNDSSTSKAIEILEKQRENILLNLNPLKKEFEPNLHNISSIWKKIANQYSDIEIDYKKIEYILGGLVYQHVVTSKPSKEEVSNLLTELQKVVVENSHNIHNSRLETLRNVLQLLKWTDAAFRDYDFSYEFKSETDAGRLRTAMDFVIEQVLSIFKQATINLDEQVQASIKLGIENQWIKEISVYGFNSRQLSVIELTLKISWKDFNSSNRYWSASDIANFTLNKTSHMEIDKMVSHLNQLSDKYKLSKDWRVQLSHEFDTEEINRILGFHHAPVFWDENYIDAKSQELSVKDMPGLGVGMYFEPREHK